MSPRPPIEHREYVGCLHVHTAYGEGTEKLPAIVKAANQAGLDFLAVCDINSIHYIEAGMEGWYDRTAVIIGQEIVGDGGHCVALGVTEDLSAHRDSPSALLSRVRQREGISIIAHPHAADEPFSGGLNRSWRDWSGVAPDALHLWTFMDDWKASVSRWNLGRRTRNPLRHLRGPHPRTLSQWDELLTRRPTAALAALDARGFRRRPRTDLCPFSYRQMFDTLRVHLLVPPFTRRFFEDKRTILSALRTGQGFLANDALAPAEGFRFEVRRPDGSIVPMGQEAPYDPPMTLRVRMPQEAEIRLITDGQVWLSNTMGNFDLELSGAGVIRLEAHIDGRPWIYSNPVYLRPAVPEMIGRSDAS